MKKCFRCSAENLDEAKFCNQCGMRMKEENFSEVRCQQCDALQKEGAKFCHVCGATQFSEKQTKKILEADWPDYKMRGQKNKRPAGMIYPLLLIPALVVFIFIVTGNQREPQHNHEGGEQQEQMSAAQMQNIVAELDTLKKLVEANPQDTTSLMRLAEMYEMAGKFSQSREYYVKYLAINSNNDDIRLRIANTYYSEKNFEGALMELEGILDRNPKNVHALFNYGLLLTHSNKVQEAVQAWQKVIEIDGNGEIARSAREAIDVVNRMGTGQSPNG